MPELCPICQTELLGGEYCPVCKRRVVDEQQKVEIATLESALRGWRHEHDAWKARAEAAEGIVAKLDKTADGVPIVKGTRLFPPRQLEDEEGAVVLGFLGVRIQDTGATNKSDGRLNLDMEEAEECYSTLAAAALAKETKP